MWVEHDDVARSDRRLFMALAQIEQDRKTLLPHRPSHNAELCRCWRRLPLGRCSKLHSSCASDECAIQAQHRVTLTGERGHIDRRMVGRQAKPRRAFGKSRESRAIPLHRRALRVASHALARLILLRRILYFCGRNQRRPSCRFHRRSTSSACPAASAATWPRCATCALPMRVAMRGWSWFPITQLGHAPTGNAASYSVITAAIASALHAALHQMKVKRELRALEILTVVGRKLIEGEIDLSDQQAVAIRVQYRRASQRRSHAPQGDWCCRREAGAAMPALSGALAGLTGLSRN